MWKRIPTASLPPQEQRESPATGRPPQPPPGRGCGPAAAEIGKAFLLLRLPLRPSYFATPRKTPSVCRRRRKGKSWRAPHFFCGEGRLRESARGSGKERGRKWGGEDAKRVFRGVMLPCDCFCGPPHLPARPRGSWAAANAIEGISPCGHPARTSALGGSKSGSP